MVVFKQLSRFYSRSSAGKHRLDVGEIRAAFALSEELDLSACDAQAGEPEPLDEADDLMDEGEMADDIDTVPEEVEV